MRRCFAGDRLRPDRLLPGREWWGEPGCGDMLPLPAAETAARLVPRSGDGWAEVGAERELPTSGVI